MELRSLFHLNHSVVLPYSVFIRSIVSDLPFRGIKVNFVVSSSFLDSNRYGSAPFALILDFPLIISISVKQCSAVRAIHRYRCPIIFVTHITSLSSLTLSGLMNGGILRELLFSCLLQTTFRFLHRKGRFPCRISSPCNEALFHRPWSMPHDSSALHGRSRRPHHLQI